MAEIALIGLAYDIAGVVVLGAALLGMNDRGIKEQAGTYWDFSPTLLKALIRQRVDAWYGVSLMVAGFLGQALGVLGADLSAFLDVALLVGLVFAVAVYKPISQTLTETKYRALSRVDRAESAPIAGE